MLTEQTTAILLPPPQRYQAHERVEAKASIDFIVLQGKANIQGIYSTGLSGLWKYSGGTSHG